MGKCIYCGHSAGWFRKKHDACEVKHNQGVEETIQLAQEALLGDGSWEELESTIQAVEQRSLLDASDRIWRLRKAFERSLDTYLEDDVLSEAEEKRATEFIHHFGLKQEDLEANGAFTRMILASIIRQLRSGEVPETRILVDGQLPFLFQKTEKLIWLFRNVDYLEQKTRTTYVGGSHGVSIRIAKGVYYRTGAFKGQPLKTEEMTYVDTGVVAITTRHLYFGGSTKKFKIPFAKLVSVEPFADGLGVHKDGVTAKPQVFQGLDGWFVSNVINVLLEQ